MKYLLKFAAITLAAMIYASASTADDCTPPTRLEPFSSPAWNWRLSFTPLRRRAYWVDTQGFWPATRERATILTAHRQANGWSPPQPASFSGQHSDFDPFVAPNGRRLFFSSERPTPDGVAAKMDLWYVTRNGETWENPVHLGAEVNSVGDELYPSVDWWGNLYFASDRDGQFDIYRSRLQFEGHYGPAEKLGSGVNTAERWEFNPEISPSGGTLLFVRLDLPDELPDQGLGFGDLYASRRHWSGFTAAQNLGPCINSGADEYHPTALWERDRLLFVRSDGGPGNFYTAPLRLPAGDEWLYSISWGKDSARH